jgi:hypothetical protein
MHQFSLHLSHLKWVVQNVSLCRRHTQQKNLAVLLWHLCIVSPCACLPGLKTEDVVHCIYRSSGIMLVLAGRLFMLNSFPDFHLLQPHRYLQAAVYWTRRHTHLPFVRTSEGSNGADGSNGVVFLMNDRVQKRSLGGETNKTPPTFNLTLNSFDPEVSTTVASNGCGLSRCTVGFTFDWRGVLSLLFCDGRLNFGDRSTGGGCFIAVLVGSNS